MATINATTAQGGYLDNTRGAALWAWEDVCYTFSTATTANVNGTYAYTRAGVTAGRSPSWINHRTSMVFDTSVITGTLTALSFNIYIEDVNDLNYTPGAYLEIVDAPTLATALTTSNWAPTIDSLAYNLPIVPGTTGYWEAVTLNAGAWAKAESNSEMTLRLRDAYYDYEYYTNLVDPSDDGSITYRYNYASFIPYLDYQVVTTFGETINGIIIANVAKIDGRTKNGIVRVLGV
jgi:hypothetical protein